MSRFSLLGEVGFQDTKTRDIEMRLWEPVLREPEKCGGWAWIQWDDLVRLAFAQGQKRLQDERRLKTMRPPIPKSIAIDGCGNLAKQEKVKDMRLFSPLVDLIEQRPGISLDNIVS